MSRGELDGDGGGGGVTARGHSYPGGDYSWRIVEEAIVLGENSWAGEFYGVICLGGNYLGVIIRGVIVIGGVIEGGIAIEPSKQVIV